MSDVDLEVGLEVTEKRSKPVEQTEKGENL
jgi:hypothetical protein